MFFEDPINYENYNTLWTVCRKASAPIGVGERSFCIQDVDMLLRDDSVSFLRPDVCIMGGITGCKIAAAIPNFEVMEMCPAPHPEWEEIQQEITEPFVIENGYMHLPKSPDLGVELRENIGETAPCHEWRGMNLTPVNMYRSSRAATEGRGSFQAACSLSVREQDSQRRYPPTSITSELP